MRLTFWIAALLLAFAWWSPNLRSIVERIVGLPASSVHLGVLRPDWVQDELLGGGSAPTVELVDRLTADLAEQHVGFLWLSPDGVVVECSPHLPWARGGVWPHRLTASQRVELSGASVPVHMTRVFEAGRELGRMATLVLDEEAHFEWHVGHGETPADIATCCMCNIQGVPLVDEFEFESIVAGRERIASYSTIGLAVAVSLLAGAAVSWWVTRRLRRISHEVMTVRDSGGLPGPFDEVSADEVGMLARAMNRMRESLLAEESERRNWIAQVTHDLRTPLTALIACLERVRGEVHSDPGAVGTIDTAMRDAERVSVLAEDLLEIAKLDARIGGIEEPVPPGELVRRVVEDLEPLAVHRGLELKSQVASGMPWLRADGDRLRRALENLIRNAIEHAREVVTVTVCARGAWVEFAVDDDGAGFPGDPERWGEDPSGGIGLVIVRRVVEAHEGRCRVENLTPSGARVGFSIPIAEEERQGATEAGESNPP